MGQGQSSQTNVRFRRHLRCLGSERTGRKQRNFIRTGSLVCLPVQETKKNFMDSQAVSESDDAETC